MSNIRTSPKEFQCVLAFYLFSWRHEDLVGPFAQVLLCFIGSEKFLAVSWPNNALVKKKNCLLTVIDPQKWNG